jgi:hypothetical protein
MIKIQSILIISIIFLLSCNNKKNLPLKAAKEFCDCMKKNGSPKNYNRARKICESEMICKYPELKTYFIDIYLKDYGETPKNIVKDATDFAFIFLVNVNQNCCYEVRDCDSLSKDSVTH